MAEWLGVKEAAEALGLSRSVIYTLVAQGKLACYRLGPNGGRLKFKASDLEAYVEGARVGPKPKAAPRPAPVPRAKYDHGY